MIARQHARAMLGFTGDLGSHFISGEDDEIRSFVESRGGMSSSDGSTTNDRCSGSHWSTIAVCVQPL